MLIRFVFLVCLLLPTASFAAENSWCSLKKQPTINIHTSTDQVSYNFSFSEKQLNGFSTTTVNPYSSNVITDVGGLMKGGIETQQRMSFGTITNRTAGQVCYWHDKMDVYLHIKPTIYVASNFPKGSCMHNAILAHEQKHVMVDREIVNKYAGLIGQALRADIMQYSIFGPAPLSQEKTLESQIKQRMQNILTTYTKQMSAERRKRQQEIDNIQEYERVNHLCPKNKR